MYFEKRLEARVCANRLKVYDLEENGRKYIGCLYFHANDFDSELLKNGAVFLYMKRNLLKRSPRFQIKVVYGSNGINYD